MHLFNGDRPIVIACKRFAAPGKGLIFVQTRRVVFLVYLHSRHTYNVHTDQSDGQQLSFSSSFHLFSQMQCNEQFSLFAWIRD